MIAENKVEEKQEKTQAEVYEEKQAEKKEEKSESEIKIFDKYTTKNIQIIDNGLKRYINLDVKLSLKSQGRLNYKFDKTKINIIERLINLIGVSGHRGKKHKIMTSHATGKYYKNTKIVLEALEIIEKIKKENPIQILVKAIENASPHDEVTVIEYGGARYPQAVDVSPMRRVNLALRNIVHGAYDKVFNKKKSISQGLAEEIIAASDNLSESFACSKRNEAEKQADAAR